MYQSLEILKNWSIIFLVENTTTEREIFPNKTALSKTHVKTNTMGSTQWAFHKESNLATYHFNFFFWKFSCSIEISYKQLIRWTNLPRVLIKSVFSLRVSLITFLLLLLFLSIPILDTMVKMLLFAFSIENARLLKNPFYLWRVPSPFLIYLSLRYFKQFSFGKKNLK